MQFLTLEHNPLFKIVGGGGGGGGGGGHCLSLAFAKNVLDNTDSTYAKNNGVILKY